MSIKLPFKKLQRVTGVANQVLSGKSFSVIDLATFLGMYEGARPTTEFGRL